MTLLSSSLQLGLDNPDPDLADICTPLLLVREAPLRLDPPQCPLSPGNEDKNYAYGRQINLQRPGVPVSSFEYVWFKMMLMFRPPSLPHTILSSSSPCFDLFQHRLFHIPDNCGSYQDRLYVGEQPGYKTYHHHRLHMFWPFILLNIFIW